MMETYTVKVLETSLVSHDVKRFRVEKPADYSFVPGQATELAINKTGWKDEKRPFTFTNLPDEDHLEFMIKTYPSHEGVTNELIKITEKDELILHEVFGAITFKGPGTFIAGGAGITPFIAILRQLRRENRAASNTLIFGNKKEADILLKKEFETMFDSRFINILSEEKVEGYTQGLIDEAFLKGNIRHFNQHFYVCGPPPMMEMVLSSLTCMGVSEDKIVKEDL